MFCCGLVFSGAPLSGQGIYTNDISGNVTNLWGDAAAWSPSAVPGYDVGNTTGNSNDIAWVRFFVPNTPTLDLVGSNYVLDTLGIVEDPGANADGNFISSLGASSLELKAIDYASGGRQIDFFNEITIKDWDDGQAFVVNLANTLDFGGPFQGSDGLRISGNPTVYFRNFQTTFGTGVSNGLIIDAAGGTKNFWIDTSAGDVVRTIPNLVVENSGNVNIDFGRSAGTNMVSVNISNVVLGETVDRLFLGGGSDPDGTETTTVNVFGDVEFAPTNINNLIKIDSAYDGAVNFYGNIVQNEDVGNSNLVIFQGNGTARLFADMVHTNGSLRSLTTRIDGGRGLTVVVDAESRLGAGVVDMRAGSVLKFNYDVFGDPGGFPGSSLTNAGVLDDFNDTHLDFGVVQSGFFDPITGDTGTPLTVFAFNGIAGNLSNAVYSGPGQNVIIQTNAIIGENALNKPTYADVGQSVWAGIRNVGGTYTNIGVQDGTNIFRGIAFSALAPQGNGDLPNTSGDPNVEPFLSGIHGSFSAAPGLDLEVLLSGETIVTPRTNGMAATFDADTGTVNFRGPGNLLVQERQGVTALSGTATNINRIGRGGNISEVNPLGLNDQNDVILDLEGVSPIQHGDTIRVTDGRVRLRNNENLGTNVNSVDTTLIIGEGASLFMDNNSATIFSASLSRGTIIFEAGGALWTGTGTDKAGVNNAVRNAMQIDPDAMLIIDDGTSTGFRDMNQQLFTHALSNMNIIIADAAFRSNSVQNATAFSLGEGRRLTTSSDEGVTFNNIILAGGAEVPITAKPYVSNVLFTAASVGTGVRTLDLNVNVDLPTAHLQVGDTNTFTTVVSDETTRALVGQSGTVRIDGASNVISSIDVVGGASLIMGDEDTDWRLINGDVVAWEPDPVPGHNNFAISLNLNLGSTIINGDLVHNATINQTTNGAVDLTNQLLIRGQSNIINGSVIVGPLGQGTGAARLLAHDQAAQSNSVTQIAGDLIIDTPFMPEAGAHNIVGRGDFWVGSNIIINASGIAYQADSNAAPNATYLRLDADLDTDLTDGVGMADRLIDGSFAQGPDGIVLRDYGMLILDFRTNDLPLVSGAIRDLAVGQKFTIDNTGPNYPGSGANDGMININRTGSGTVVYQLTNVWMNDGSYLRINENTGTRALVGLTLMGTGTISLGSTAENESFELTDVRSDTPGQGRVLQIGATNGPNFTAFPTALLGVSTPDVTFDIFNGSLSVTNGSGDVQGSVKVWAGSTFEVVGAGSEEILNLSGDGLVLGNVTVSNTLSPGLGTGTLTVTGTVTFLPPSILSFELDGSTTNVGGGINDLLVLGGGTGVGDLTLDGTLNVTELSAFTNQGWAAGDFWTLIAYDGNFTDNGLDLGSLPILDDGLVWALDTTFGGEVRLAIVIPEPSTWALLTVGMGAAGILLRRRREQ